MDTSFLPVCHLCGTLEKKKKKKKTRTQVKVTSLQATTHHQHVAHEKQRGHKCQANVRSQQSVQVPVCEREGTYMCRLRVCSRASSECTWLSCMTRAYLGRKQRGLFCKFVFVLCSPFLSCASCCFWGANVVFGGACVVDCARVQVTTRSGHITMYTDMCSVSDVPDVLCQTRHIRKRLCFRLSFSCGARCSRLQEGRVPSCLVCMLIASLYFVVFFTRSIFM